MMKKFIAILIVFVSLIALTGCGGKQAQNDLKYRLSDAQYPEMAPYPDESKFTKSDGYFDSDGFDAVYEAWQADRLKQLRQQDGYEEALEKYLRAAIPQFLAGNVGENKTCSPLNIYMALAMLAEISDGSSREQILNFLGAEDIHALRAEAAALWNANYCDDGALTSIMADSLWLNENIGFKQDTTDALAKHYYASSFRGKMGSDDFNKALMDWINSQTGGLLGEQAKSLKTDPETVLALASTIYFRDKWESEFLKSNTAPETFHSAVGDISCDFMRQSTTNAYYWSDSFSACYKNLEGSGAMWFILPDENITPEELLSDKKTADFIISGGKSAESKDAVINLSVPKFDIASDFSLIPALKSIGITDIFDKKTSDFSPLTDDIDEVFLSDARHAARVSIDEEGVSASAYTVMAIDGACAPPDEKVNFTLNRPFIFVITAADGLPLFVGIVHQPQA